MKQERVILAFIFLIALFLTSCNKENTVFTDANDSKAYMPMRPGTRWEYQIDSFIFSKAISGNKIDSNFYLIREIVADTFTNSGGELVYMIDKYEKPVGSTAPWQIRTVYSAFFSNNRCIRVEENNPFIKFHLPPVLGQRWDGNAMTDKNQTTEVGGESIEIFKDWESRIRKFDFDYNDGVHIFKHCFTVELADYETLIDFRSGSEIYSKNVGLVYRELYVLDTQCNGNPANCKDIAWELKAEKGFIVKQRLSSFQY